MLQKNKLDNWINEADAAKKVGITKKEFRTKAVYKREWKISYSKVTPRIYMYYVPDILQLFEQNSNLLKSA